MPDVYSGRVRVGTITTGRQGSALRRVGALTERISAELPAAREAVAAMPAGAGAFLDTFVAEITARAATVRFNLDHDAQDPQTDDPVEQNPA
jgi:hypothetical protein